VGGVGLMTYQAPNISVKLTKMIGPLCYSEDFERFFHMWIAADIATNDTKIKYKLGV
jgi:hypothetical protein